MGAGNTDLGITLGARVDTSQAQKDINAFTRDDKNNKSREIHLNADVNLDKVNQKLEKAINTRGWTKKVEEDMQKISTIIKTGLSRTLDDGTIVNDLTKVTETFKNNFGKIQERVTIFKDSAMKPLTSSLQTVKEGVKEISSATSVVVKDIDGVTTKVTTLEKTIEDTDGVEHKIITTTNEWLDSQNRLHKEINITDENNKKLSASTKTVTEDTKKAAKLYQELADGLVKTQQAVKTTGKFTLVDENGVKTVKQMVNGIETLVTTTKEYTTVQGTLVKETKELNKVTGETTVHTEVIKNKEKEIQKVKELTEHYRKLRIERKLAEQKQNQIDNALVSTTTTTTTSKTTQFGDKDGRQYDALVTKIRKVDEANRVVIQTTYEFTNAQGQLVKQTRITDENNKKLAADIIEVSDANKQATDSTEKLSNVTEKAAKETKTFGVSLSDAIERLVKYTVAMLPIQMVRKGISEAITTIKDFDSALIEFRKVSDLAGESLTQYVAKLAEMGEITGSTMQAMVEASTEFKKSGFSDEDSAKLASIAEKYRNIADEEISAGESASFIIAQMKAFNIEADQAEHIIDAVNEVANNFSVSSADLATNLGNMSAIMAINNVSLEEQVGMLTGVAEITRNASSASRGLVMISSRLTQVLDDTSSTGKKLTKIYEDLGIELKDESGQLRGHYEILGDLASQWNTLSENEQKYIALTSAGARQQQNFVALMENWNQVAKATATAYDSMGSAQRENEKVMDSIEKKVEILKSQFQQIVIGKGGLQDFAKSLLQLGVYALKFINAIGGLPTILITITSLLIGIKAIKIYDWLGKIVGNLGNIKNALTSSVDAWKTYINDVKAAKVAIVGFDTETATLGQTLQASIPLIGLVATAIGLITSAIVAHNQAVEEQRQKIRENISAFEDEYQTLGTTIEQIQNEEVSREELNSIIDSNFDEYEAERLKLLDLNEAREETIRLLEEEKKAKAQELVDTGLTEYEDALENVKSGYEEFYDWLDDIASKNISIASGETNFSMLNKAGVFEAQGVEEQIDALKRFKDILLDVRSQAKEAGESDYNIEKINSELRNVETTLTTLNEKSKEDISIVNAFNRALKLLGLHYEESSGEIVEGSKKSAIAIEEERKGLEKLKHTSKHNKIELEDLKKKYNITSDAVQRYIEAHQEENLTTEQATDLLIEEAEELEQVENSVEKLDEAYKDTFSATNSLVSSIDKVSSALEEQEKNGSLSLKTQLELIEAGYETALMYDKETGACKLNEKAVQALVEAKIENHIQDLETLATKIEDKLFDEANAATVSANAFLDLAAAKNLANEASLENSVGRGYDASYGGWGNNAGYLTLDDASVENARNQISSINSEIDALRSNLGKIKSGGIGAFSSTAKGAGKAKDATKDLNKELEETKKKYETVIKWISKQYDNKIKAIKKEKDAAIKPIEAEIKAREKAKDKALDAIEEQINALEKEKKAREKYWQDQIDALKEANEARKDALELQEKLDALEKARNTKVKVYKEGEGFVYDVDRTAVAEAQKELDEYLSEKAYEDELERLEKLKDAESDNYQSRLDALNEYKDKTQESYEEQIENLKKHKEALEEQYDAEVENYQEYKQQFEDLVNDYQNKQEALLFEQLTGIKAESDNWMTRLDNLAEFVKKYNELQAQLDTGNTNVSNDATMKSGTPSSGVGNKTSGVPAKPFNQGAKTAYVPTSVTNAINQQKTGKKTIGVGSGVYHYASGVNSIKDNELAIVGENPNQEIVIGSKLNNGELMSLNKGSGVVNADSSSTLAGMLNQVGKFGSSGFGSGNGTLNNNINNDSLVINGVTVQGANIKDPETFVNGLLNLKSEALQRAYRHR